MTLFLLDDVVRQNIDPFELVSDKLIIDALTKVHFWSTLQSLGGLDAQMKTQPLSQGQQQLFCVARAMLGKGKILILDEATSNVDLETDRWIQEVKFKDRTIITVAHRIETILDANVVALLDKGVLVEFGSLKELISGPSLFKELNHNDGCRGMEDTSNNWIFQQQMYKSKKSEVCLLMKYSNSNLCFNIANPNLLLGSHVHCILYQR
jgi:ABC-type multidrug transport system fused ATPase/permease subunit